jgi:hypothetical protein
LVKRSMSQGARQFGKADSDSPKITRKLFATMRPAAEIDPGVIEAAKRSRGRPRVDAPRKVVSVRMSALAAEAWRVVSPETRAGLIAKIEAAALAKASTMYRFNLAMAAKKGPATERLVKGQKRHKG